MTNMPSDLALRTAAKAWQVPFTAHLTEDPALLHAFANILDKVWSEPWLGKATTGQLLDEVRARVNLSYKTTDPVPAPPTTAYPPDSNPC